MTDPIQLDSFPPEILLFHLGFVQTNIWSWDEPSVVKSQLCSEVTPADPVSCCASEDIGAEHRAFVSRYFPDAGFFDSGSRFTPNDYRRYLRFLQQEYGANFLDDPQSCGSRDQSSGYVIYVDRTKASQQPLDREESTEASVEGSLDPEACYGITKDNACSHDHGQLRACKKYLKQKMERGEKRLESCVSDCGGQDYEIYELPQFIDAIEECLEPPDRPCRD